MKSMLFWRSVLVVIVAGVAQVSAVRAEHEFPFRANNPFETLRRLDTNRDKRLSEQEFVGERGGAARAKARKHFRMLDENGDDHLSWKELRKKL